MEELLEKQEKINDPRQSWKVKHKLSDVIAIVFFAMLANADEWEQIQAFAVMYEEMLREYLELPNGIPSHDTIRRVMGMLEPSVFRQFQTEWNELLSRGEGEKLRKIINIDGKTMRGSGNAQQEALHVVSAWSKEDGLCLGQTAVSAKENEIIAIPELLDRLQIKGQVITIDAIGTQTKIVEKIVARKGDYVLALKGNQANLHEDVRDYFADEGLLISVQASGHYQKTVEKARSQIETREYFQTDDIGWLADRAKWKNLTSIGMVRKTIEKDGCVSVEQRYYISSLAPEIHLFAKAVRGHWAIESMHWQLDVTFREDHNATLDTQAALNMNIMRKFCLSVLKTLDIGRKASMKLKRYYVCCNPIKFIAMAMALLKPFRGLLWWVIHFMRLACICEEAT